MRFFRQTLLIVCLGLPCALWAQPVAQDDVFTTAEDTEITHNLLSNDTSSPFAIDPTTVDLDTSTPLIIDNTLTTADGSFSVDASGVLTFVPTADFFGTASLQYTVQNSDVTPATSNPANITITVTPVNDAPVLSALIHVNIAMNTSGPANPFTVSDVDNDAGDITVIAATNNSTLLPLSGIDLVHLGGGDWTVAVTPANGERGSATVTLRINDGLSPDVIGTFTVTVDNTEPTITAIGNYTINEDASTAPILFTVNDGETDPGSLTISATSSDVAVIPVSSIVLSGTDGSRQVVVTPLANTFSLAPVQITLTVKDGDGGSASQAFTVDVNSVNDLPLISTIPPTSTNVNQATAAIPFTISDIETSATDLVVTARSSDQSIVVNADIVLGGSAGNRTVKVTPVLNKSGSVLITLRVTDGNNEFTESSFTLNIIDTAPTITTIGNISILRNTTSAAIPFTVADVDQDASLLAVTASTTSNPALLTGAGISLVHGSGGNWTIAVTPIIGQVGSADVKVQVSDGSLTAQSTFTVTVNAPLNTNPTISTIGNVTISEDTSTPVIDFTVNDAETDPNLLTIDKGTSDASIIPTSGIVLTGTGTDRHVTITPLANKFSVSPVQITLTVKDGSGGSAKWTFTVQVNSVNDLPIVSTVPPTSTNVNQATAAIPFTVSDIETSATDLVVTARSSDQGIVSDADIVLGGSAGNRTVKVTPVLNKSGSVLITLRVTDGNNEFTESSFTLNIIDTAPTITTIGNISILRNTTSAAIPFTVADVDQDASLLAVTASTTSNPALLTGAGISLVHGSGGNWTIAVTPIIGQVGSADVKVQVSDGSLTAQSTFTVTVNAPLNTNPTISTIGNVTISEDTSTPVIDFTVNDAETDPNLLTIDKGTSDASIIPTSGIVLTGTGTDRHVTITPLANKFSVSPVQITLTVKDGSGGSAKWTFTVQVNSVNDLPIVSTVPPTSTNVNQATAAIPFTISDIETSATDLVVTAKSSDQGIVSDADIVLGGSAGNRTVKITPVLNKSGSVLITLRVTDGNNEFTESSFTLNIIDTAPTITTIGNISILRNTTSAAIPFTVADVDQDASLLAVTASTTSNPALLTGAGISLVHGSGGNWTIAVTPIIGQVGSADVKVQVSDGSLTAQSTFTVTVNAPLNTNPTISTIGNVTISEDTSTPVIDFTVNDAETDPNLLTIDKGTSDASIIPTSGIVLTGTGTDRHVTITPLANKFSVSPVQITLTVKDGSGGSAKWTFTVQVNSVNDLPIVSTVPPTSTNVNQATAAIPFTISDIETSATDLVVTARSSDQSIVANADIVLGGSAGNRTVKVTPVLNKSGSVLITLRVTDGNNEFTESSFNLNIINTAPTIGLVADRSIPENSETGKVDFTVGDLETPDALVMRPILSTNVALVDNTNVFFGGSGGLRNFNVRPKLNQSGSARITLTVSDGDKEARTDFLLTVLHVDAPPTITQITDFSINEDVASPDVHFTVGDAETAVDDLVVTGTSDGGPIASGNILLTKGIAGDWTVKVTPTANASGVSNITIKVTDDTPGTPETASMTFKVTVVPVNDAPTMALITDKSTNEDTPTTTFNVTIADIDTPLNDLTVTGVALDDQTLIPTANIVVTGNGTNSPRSVTITPASNLNGATRITMTVVDNGSPALSASRTFNLTVNAVADAPTIDPISDQTINEDQATGLIDFTVADVDGGTITVTATSDDQAFVPDANIVLGGSGANRTVKVTPAPNKSSATTPVTITLRVTESSDPPGIFTTTTFKLHVTPVNDAPTVSSIAAQNISESTSTGALSFTVADVDNLAGSLSVTASSSVTALIPDANLVLGGSVGARTITATPIAGASGTTTITVSVNDNSGTPTAITQTTFVVNVAAVDDLPTISVISNASTNEDTPTGAISFTINDSDTPIASLILDATSTNTTLVPNGNIVLGGSGTARTVTITPALNQNSTNSPTPATITITVSDGPTRFVSSAFTLTVVAVNDLPTISAISDLSTNEDTPTGNIGFTVGDIETPSGSLTVTATSDNQAFVPDANITLGGSGASRTIKLTPASDASGPPVTITITVDDGTTTAFRKFKLTINNVDDPPTISLIGNQDIQEDTNTGAIAFTINDVDTPIASLTLGTNSSNTTLIPLANVVLGGSGTNRTVTVTPAANQSNQQSTISITVSDATSTTTRDFIVKVEPVDDPPAMSVIANRTINEDTDTGVITFTVSDPETASSLLQVTATSGNAAIVPDANITLGGTTGTRTIKVTPAPDQNGTVTISVKVTDEGGNSFIRKFDVIINPVNDIPVIQAQQALTIDEGQQLALSLSQLTIVDPDNTPAQLTLYVTGGANYSITGANTITPNPAFHGDLNVPVFVGDGTGFSAQYSMLIKVNSTNDPPVITAQSPLVTNEDQTITLQPSNFTITDLDNDPNFTLILSPGPNYTFTGTTVTPDPNYNGVIFVGVKANDGQASSVAVFNAQITINPVNDPPTVTGQATLITSEETPLTLLIGNFIVSDPEPTSYTLSVLPPIPGAHYTLTGNTITPDLDYFGPLTVPITVSDGFANSATYNATVTVTDVNDAPVIVSQNSLSTVEDIPLTLLLTNFTVTDVDDPGYPTSFSLTVLPGTNYTYAGTTITPTLDYSGPLNVNIQIRDPRGANSANFVANVTVTNAADAPNITGQKVVTMDEDQSRIITLDDLNYTDKDTPPASLILSVAAGTNYTVSGATITPSPNFFGTLTVNVQLNDGQANSNVWPLQVTVNNVNDPPTFDAIGPVTILEDAAVQTITITGISPGPLESEPLTFTYVSDNTSLIKNIVESPTYNHTAPNNTITFKPEANQSGTANITVTIIDQGTIVPKTFTITVTPVNDAPTLTIIPPTTITEDASEQIITLTGLSPGGGGTESDQNLTFVVSADNQLFETLTIEPATINGTTSTASLKVKPKANANGVSNITVKVVDSGPFAPPNVNFFTRTFAMTVNAVNDDPIVSSTPILQAQPGVPYQYQVTATDADGDEMTITAPGLPAWLTLTQVSNGVATLTGTPPAGLSGDVAIALFITDPTGPAEALSYTITVNSPPALADVFVTTLEDNQYSFKTADFQAGFTDPDGNQMIEISVTALPKRGQLLKANNTPVAIGDTFAVADIATLSYKPKDDDNENDTLQWNGADAYGVYALLPAYMTMKITPENDAPRLLLGEDTLRYRLGSEEMVQLTQAFDGSDPDGDDITGAEIVFKITDNFEYTALHDYLLFTKTSKITGEFNTGNGSLKLVGKATAAEYVAAIRSIKYQYKDAKELELNLRAVNITMTDGKKSSDPAFSRVIKLIYSFEDLNIPTAFTPNQDNVNETWKISSPTGDGTLQLYEKAQVKVYNKHGALLWHTEGFNESWNGIYDGSILPSDTYFYTIDLNFNKVRYKGTVTILR